MRVLCACLRVCFVSVLCACVLSVFTCVFCECVVCVCFERVYVCVL